MPPPLSIVIPSHNRPDLLHLCLESVVRHAPQGTEILVVDDASSNEAASETARRVPGVQVLRLDRHSGFCVAANRGMQAVHADIVELLNDDTQVTAGWAEAALAHFEDTSVGAVAPLVLRLKGAAHEVSGSNPTAYFVRGSFYVDSAGDRYFTGGVAGKRGHGRPLGAEFLQGGEVFGVSASSAFYRRDLVLHVGGFPEHFGAYFEDVDLAFRLHWAGARIWYEPNSRIWHAGSASYGPPAKELLERQSRNEELVFWRNLPTAQLLRSLPAHAAVVAGKAWRRWREGQLLPFLRGRLRAVGQAAAILGHRRHLAQLRAACDNRDWGIESRFWE